MMKDEYVARMIQGVNIPDIRPNTNMRATRVFVTKYRQDICKYEKRLKLYRVYRAFFEMLMSISMIVCLVMTSACDTEGPGEKIVIFVLLAALTVCGICGMALYIPAPKLPKGVGRKGKSYVITDGRYHEGCTVIITNSTEI